MEMEWKWTGAYSSHSYTFWVFFSVCFELHKNLLSKEKAWKVICVRGLFALCDLFFPGLSKLSGSIRYQVVLSLYIVQTISPSSHHRLFFFSLLLVWSFHFLFLKKSKWQATATHYCAAAVLFTLTNLVFMCSILGNLFVCMWVRSTHDAHAHNNKHKKKFDKQRWWVELTKGDTTAYYKRGKWHW